MQPKTLPALAAVLTLLLALSAQANEYQPMAPVYAAIHALLKQKLDQNLHNPRITIKKLGDRTRLPRCTTPLQYRLLQRKNRTTGRQTVVVTCEKPFWKVFVSARIDAEVPVVISTALIPRNTLIRPEQLGRRFLDSTRVPSGVLTRIEDAVGKRARRAIAPNTLIKAQMLLPPYWVRKGRPVTIIARLGSVEVHAKGVAQKDAVENEMVAVKNLRSGKVVRALVIAPDTVLVP